MTKLERIRDGARVKNPWPPGDPVGTVPWFRLGEGRNWSEPSGAIASPGMANALWRAAVFDQLELLDTEPEQEPENTGVPHISVPLSEPTPEVAKGEPCIQSRETEASIGQLRLIDDLRGSILPRLRKVESLFADYVHKTAFQMLCERVNGLDRVALRFEARVVELERQMGNDVQRVEKLEQVVAVARPFAALGSDAARLLGERLAELDGDADG